MLAPQSIMFPGLHPMAMMSTGRGFCGAPPPFPPPIYAPLPGQGGAQQGAGDSQVIIETCVVSLISNLKLPDH